MPIEAERTSVTFTDEAEVVLRRLLNRLDRQLRGNAIDEAVRARGFPAEITGSDVHKASMGFFATRRLAPNVRDRIAHGETPSQVFSEFLEVEEKSKRAKRPKSSTEKLASLYMRFGIAVAFGGLLYAPLLKGFMHLAGDPVWKIGLMISVSGIGLALMGYVLSRMLLRRQR